jgi:hypothetical protein
MLNKSRRSIFGFYFIDDINMPAIEEYGAQPPI